MVQRDVPRALAAHRESAQHDALVVDLEALLHGRDRLEHVRLAGPVPARAVDPAEAIQLDLAVVGHRALPGRTFVKEKMNSALRRVVLPAVQPDVEARRLRRVVVLRQRDSVRLHRAIDLRVIRVNLLCARVPRRCPRCNCLRALDPLIQHRHRMIDRVLRAEQLRKLEQHPAGLGVDLHVAHQFRLGMRAFNSRTAASICSLLD